MLYSIVLRHTEDGAATLQAVLCVGENKVNCDGYLIFLSLYNAEPSPSSKINVKILSSCYLMIII